MNSELLKHLEEAGYFFVFNFIELAVLFLGVSFLVEIINLFINPQKVQKVLSSNKGGYLIASALGSITPFCSCSTIPLTLGLLKARAAFGPIMTFLFTSPLLNPIIIAVFWSAFGYEVTIIYALIAFFVSILAGFTLEKLGFEKFIKKEIFAADKQEEASCCDSKEKKEVKVETSCCSTKTEKPLSKPMFTNIKPNNISQSSCCDSVPPKQEVKKENKWKKISDKALMKKTWKQFLSFAPYIAIGIAIGAFVHGFVPQEWLTKYASADNPLAVPISAIIGVPLYIRAESMVGLAPALLDKGVSMGSILALTVAGAGASLPEMIMLKKIFKLPIMIFFVLSVFTMAIGCGFLVNLYFA
ncbi:permease [Poseidonibacter lekithochrous]|uniref:permease n=1 Tax=Poseidonibacter lekithochrous TaxID=1904463 RepID=UPI0008FCC8E9|nr:permease [Poseidonibacter lekithochrous]QKJ23649.1 ArsP family permease [Poseidonibacter lekithochrous]